MEFYFDIKVGISLVKTTDIYKTNSWSFKFFSNLFFIIITTFTWHWLSGVDNKTQLDKTERERWNKYLKTLNWYYLYVFYSHKSINKVLLLEFKNLETVASALNNGLLE